MQFQASNGSARATLASLQCPQYSDPCGHRKVAAFGSGRQDGALPSNKILLQRTSEAFDATDIRRNVATVLGGGARAVPAVIGRRDDCVTSLSRSDTSNDDRAKHEQRDHDQPAKDRSSIQIGLKARHHYTRARRPAARCNKYR